MLSHMTEHVNLDCPGKHVPLLKERLDKRAKEMSLSETVSYNLTYLAYKHLLSGNSYRQDIYLLLDMHFGMPTLYSLPNLIY